MKGCTFAFGSIPSHHFTVSLSIHVLLIFIVTCCSQSLPFVQAGLILLPEPLYTSVLYGFLVVLSSQNWNWNLAIVFYLFIYFFWRWKKGAILVVYYLLLRPWKHNDVYVSTRIHHLYMYQSGKMLAKKRDFSKFCIISLGYELCLIN